MHNLDKQSTSIFRLRFANKEGNSEWSPSVSVQTTRKWSYGPYIYIYYKLSGAYLQIWFIMHLHVHIIIILNVKDSKNNIDWPQSHISDYCPPVYAGRDLVILTFHLSVRACVCLKHFFVDPITH